MITDSEFYQISDRAHFLGASSAVLLPLALGFQPRWAFIVAGLMVLFAAVKEFYWDVHYETPEVAGSGLRDFLGYVLGAGTALALWGLRVWL